MFTLTLLYIRAPWDDEASTFLRLRNNQEASGGLRHAASENDELTDCHPRTATRSPRSLEPRVEAPGP